EAIADPGVGPPLLEGRDGFGHHFPVGFGRPRDDDGFLPDDQLIRALRVDPCPRVDGDACRVKTGAEEQEPGGQGRGNWGRRAENPHEQPLPEPTRHRPPPPPLANNTGRNARVCGGEAYPPQFVPYTGGEREVGCGSHRLGAAAVAPAGAADSTGAAGPAHVVPARAPAARLLACARGRRG